MINLTPLLIILVASIILLLLALGIKNYSRKLGNLYKNHPSESIQYKRDLTIGLVSAMIVVIIDKVIALIVNGISNIHIDTSSVFSFFASSVGVIIILLLMIFFLLFCLLWLTYLGFPKDKR